MEILAKEMQFARIAGLSMCGEFHDTNREQEIEWYGSSEAWRTFKSLHAKDDRGEFFDGYPWQKIGL